MPGAGTTVKFLAWADAGQAVADGTNEYDYYDVSTRAAPVTQADRVARVTPQEALCVRSCISVGRAKRHSRHAGFRYPTSGCFCLFVRAGPVSQVSRVESLPLRDALRVPCRTMTLRTPLPMAPLTRSTPAPSTRGRLSRCAPSQWAGLAKTCSLGPSGRPTQAYMRHAALGNLLCMGSKLGVAERGGSNRLWH